ncbi:MAG: hypothetical protein MZV63_64720 [Marinilabiliales bacterium]|nr:hypothetical protein [Marinilabiliales bacterium]
MIQAYRFLGESYKQLYKPGVESALNKELEEKTLDALNKAHRDRAQQQGHHLFARRHVRQDPASSPRPRSSTCASSSSSPRT